MVTVLEGQGKFTVDGKEYFVSAGETLIMPAEKQNAFDSNIPGRKVKNINISTRKRRKS